MCVFVHPVDTSYISNASSLEEGSDEEGSDDRTTADASCPVTGNCVITYTIQFVPCEKKCVL